MPNFGAMARARDPAQPISTVHHPGYGDWFRGGHVTCGDPIRVKSRSLAGSAGPQKLFSLGCCVGQMLMKSGTLVDILLL